MSLLSKGTMSIKELFEKKYISTTIAFLLFTTGVYVSYLNYSKQKIPEIIIKTLNSPMFNMLILSLIYVNAIYDPAMSIISSIVYLYLVDYINTQEFRTKLMEIVNLKK